MRSSAIRAPVLGDEDDSEGDEPSLDVEHVEIGEGGLGFLEVSRPSALAAAAAAALCMDLGDMMVSLSGLMRWWWEILEVVGKLRLAAEPLRQRSAAS